MYEITIGNERGFDGVKFLVDSAETEASVRAAYDLSDSEFEMIVDRLCDAGKAEYLG